MTTTPTPWLDSVQVNPSSSGFQGHHESIGLSNGNFLVVFSDDSGTIGSGAGRDIIGVIYDAQGNVVTTAFQVNVTRNIHDEEMPSIAAANDGGFYMAYEDRDSSGQTIIVERFDADGNWIDSGTVQTDPGTPLVSNPSIAVDPSDNSVFVSYHWSDGNDDTIRGKALDANLNVVAGTPTDGYILRADEDVTSSSGPFQNNSTVLNNGTYVTVFREPDGTDNGIEFRFSDASSGAPGLNLNVGSTGSNGTLDYNPSVAALADGGFVVVWQENEGSDDNIMFARYNASGILQGSVTTVIDTANNYQNPAVIGLEDGGFFIAAHDSTADNIEGTRYDATGTRVGAQMFILESGISNYPDIHLGRTSDGRILLTYDNPDGDIYTEIWDPRDPWNITADPGDGQVTAHITADSTVFGSTAIDTIFGQAGNDTVFGSGGNDVIFGGDGDNALYGGTGGDSIFGGSGADLLRGDGGNDDLRGNNNHDMLVGGGGHDILYGGGGHDTLSGGAGNNTLQGGGGRDSIFGGSDADLLRGDGGNDDLRGNGGNDQLIGGDGDDTLYGGTGNDTLSGGNGSNTLQGGGGADRIFGGGSADLLRGDGGNDDLRGNGGNDRLDGGDGDDTLYGGTGNDTLSGGAGSNTLQGGGGGDRIFGGGTADLLRGDGGNDDLRGNNGNDLLIGGDGNDMLFGGGGNDEFVFTNADGNDTVFGFSSSNAEEIDLSGVNAITGFNDLINNHLVNSSGDAMIVYGPHSILLSGVSFNDVGFGQAYSANDFVF